jgi:hypothetical protein
VSLVPDEGAGTPLTDSDLFLLHREDGSLHSPEIRDKCCGTPSTHCYLLSFLSLLYVYVMLFSPLYSWVGSFTHLVSCSYFLNFNMFLTQHCYLLTLFTLLSCFSMCPVMLFLAVRYYIIPPFASLSLFCLSAVILFLTLNFHHVPLAILMSWSS